MIDESGEQSINQSIDRSTLRTYQMKFFVFINYREIIPQFSNAGYFSGSKETLWFNPQKEGVIVRQELLKFHDQFYSSNIMCLVVIGKGIYRYYNFFFVFSC